MPANLTPQYLEVEKRFKQARETDEKLSALQEMLAIIPKHKGTEKLRGELKKKLSALRKESALTKPVSRSDSFHVKREGSRQLVLVGCPNSGKSSLLSRLTNAQTEVADYPFSTRTPHPGMLNHQGVNLQLVDLPPVSEHHMDYWLPQIIPKLSQQLQCLCSVKTTLEKRLLKMRGPGPALHFLHGITLNKSQVFIVVCLKLCDSPCN